MVNLPHGTGKPVTVCVFAKGPDAEVQEDQRLAVAILVRKGEGARWASAQPLPYMQL